jgi:uncharacterized membrane protein
MAPRFKFDDRRMETIMGRLLQVGVLLASAVVLVGGVLYVRAHLGAAVNYRAFAGEPATLRSARGLLRLVRMGDPTALIQLGVVLLVATPVARVVFAVVGFALERDRFYVAVSVAVLAILAASLLYSV